MKQKLKKPLKIRIPLLQIHLLLQTIILCWLVCRVELIHKEFHQIGLLMRNITEVLSDEIVAARDQFQAAIEAILSLFGGSES